MWPQRSQVAGVGVGESCTLSVDQRTTLDGSRGSYVRCESESAGTPRQGASRRAVKAFMASLGLRWVPSSPCQHRQGQREQNP